VWLTGRDPITGEERGHQRLSPEANLLLDGTLNRPKSYSLAALLQPELAFEFEALQDRLRDRIVLTWQTEINARRGHGGFLREEVTRIEVVELQPSPQQTCMPSIWICSLLRRLWTRTNGTHRAAGDSAPATSVLAQFVHSRGRASLRTATSSTT
jgi:hypothetical protein